MLTRLKVSGFKNLVDVDIRFGPFTCIAGANGTGKSNLFDAIHFLSLLMDHSLIEAAMSVRSDKERASDPRSIFHRVGDKHDEIMSFEAEMIVPKEGRDHLGQEAKAGVTFLKYSLELRYSDSHGDSATGGLEITKEELSHITKGDTKSHLLFDHAATWRETAITGIRRVPYLISTESRPGGHVVKRHQDGRSGRTLETPASTLTRPVLSVAAAADSPTATLARAEIRSWRLLQLEPSSLRKPSEFNAPTILGPDGANLAATLFRLARTAGRSSSPDVDVGVYAKVANRLSELVGDVYEIKVDKDDKRDLFTLTVTDRHRTSYPAMALSDGTLRFLALAVLELDPQVTGVLCLEEPENGIHPERIPAMLRLLRDIATDPYESVGEDNPLRQVIINTHSPAVVCEVPEDSLVVAEPREVARGDSRFQAVRFSGLSNT